MCSETGNAGFLLKVAPLTSESAPTFGRFGGLDPDVVKASM
jgi:hypothetical protein